MFKIIWVYIAIFIILSILMTLSAYLGNKICLKIEKVFNTYINTKYFGIVFMLLFITFCLLLIMVYGYLKMI